MTLRIHRVLAWILLSLVVWTAGAQAASTTFGGSFIFLPLVSNGITWPEIALGTGIIGFEAPVYVTHARDGSGRLYVVEQAGRIRVVAQGELRSAPLLDIRDRVVCCGERGLLGLAFPPGPGAKDHLYVNYTAQVDGQLVTRISRFAMDPATILADPASEAILVTIPQPYANHNGGHLAFGPDGYLYIAVGDGGGAGDPDNHAQNLSTLLGTLLRIDVEGAPVGSYLVPPTNPFVDREDARGEIWAYGLRNPWRFSFDRGSKGDLYIGDVGQNAWEEIDYQPATSPGGENYGWPILEGSHCYRTDPCDPTGTVLPIWEYNHDNGDRAVIGGYVYRGQNIPELQGIYLFGDWISGRVWGLRPIQGGWRHTLFLDTPYLISSFGEDEQGELWLVDHAGGGIYPIVAQQ